MSTSERIVAVVGATGTGKSELALDLAERLDGEVINTDSMQFYRGMDIGTAKLPVHERRGIPHHLMDFLEVSDEASVAGFQADCRKAIDDCLDRGRTPVLVGGSGLYVRAALDVLEFPPTDPAVRQRLEQELEDEGLQSLRRRLAEVDEASASQLTDARRIIRALEVFDISGRPFISYMPKREYLRPTVQIGLTMPRPELHRRLETRIARMMDSGLIAETERLLPAGLRESKTARQAIGYRQALAVIDGEMTEAEAADSTLIATRQFARRQETWFGADPRVTWFDAAEPGLLDGSLTLLGGGAAGRRTLKT